MNLKGNNDQFGFAGTHEYTLVYAKNIEKAKVNEFDIDEEEVLDKWEEDEIGPYKKGANLKSTGVNAPRAKRPNLFFPIFINEKNKEAYVTENDKPLNSNDIKILPITNKQEMSWRWSKTKIRNEQHNIILI
jgi:adenine-specific DNA-methyltransferase